MSGRAVEHPLWLASSSQRRRALLDEAGVAYRLLLPTVDDSILERADETPQQWVMDLARWKAKAALAQLRDMEDGNSGTVLAADTVCVDGDRLLGKPADEADARRMIRTIAGAEHVTMTGVCLMWVGDGDAEVWVDATRVVVGDLAEDMVAAYIESGNWHGKAGGYNLSERVADGWPITVEGDPTTVMGLPMEQLAARLGARA